MTARIVLAILITCFFTPAHAADKGQEKWVVYYGDALTADNFAAYDLIVFNSEKHPALRPLRNQKKTLLGYLSLDEVAKSQPDFETIKSLGVLLGENKNQPGHYIIDVRNPQWIKYIIEEKIPAILFQRFDGIMLDSVGTLIQAGMKDATLTLLSAIRMHYPSTKIMLNSGFAIYPEAAKSIDMVLAENTLVDSTDSKHLKRFDDATYNRNVAVLNDARKVNPALKIYTLDYWQPADRKGIDEIYKRHRDNHFIPYVATPDLQKPVVTDE